MTAALTVTGFVGNMPAAHAGGNANCSFIVANVVCVGQNNVNVPVTITVTNVANGVDISVLENDIIPIIVKDNNVNVLDALNNITVNVKDITILKGNCVDVVGVSGITKITQSCN
jgi:hypothetical protein